MPCRSSHRGGSRHRSPSGRARNNRARRLPRSAMVEHACETRPGSRLCSAAVRKMTRAPGAAVRVISVHSALSCASVIQSCASSSTKRSTDAGRLLRQKLGEVDVMDGDAADVLASASRSSPCPDRRAGRLRRASDSGGQRPARRNSCRFSGKSQASFSSRALSTLAMEPSPEVISESYCAGGMPSPNSEDFRDRTRRIRLAFEERRKLLVEEAALVAEVLRSRIFAGVDAVEARGAMAGGDEAGRAGRCGRNCGRTLAMRRRPRQLRPSQ